MQLKKIWVTVKAYATSAEAFVQRHQHPKIEELFAKARAWLPFEIRFK